MKLLVYYLLLVLSQAGGSLKYRNLRGHRENRATESRLTEQAYYSTNDPAVLGVPNVNVTAGNPLKGLFGGTRWAPPPLPDSVPFSLEWYNVALDEMMVGENQFDWSLLDSLLQGTASRKKHAVFSIFIHWPGQPLRLPSYLLNITELIEYEEDRYSPYYGDPILLNALQQFITAFGDRYDGDTRIFQIHMGLLGFWGEVCIVRMFGDEEVIPCCA